MPTRAQVTYFGSGPARLPTRVLEESAAALLNFRDTGLGLGEISHRSDFSLQVLAETGAGLVEFLRVPEDDWHVLFMQAGGCGQFSAVPLNAVTIWLARQRAALLADHNGDAALADDALADELAAHPDRLMLDYAVTGRWSELAAQEAERLLGPERVNVVTDGRRLSADKVTFGCIPDAADWQLSADPALLYYCDNETVDGVEFPDFPPAYDSALAAAAAAGRPPPLVVADVSSNVLTRRICWDKLSVVFFSAQKNVGIAGVTVVLVKKVVLPPALAWPAPALLRRLGLPVAPVMSCWEKTRASGSLYNTLPIFQVHLMGLVLRDLLGSQPGKVEAVEEWTNAKAARSFGVIESHPAVYHLRPQRAVASRTNICFTVSRPGEAQELALKAFLDGATARGMTGLKGHRSVGGVRIANLVGVSAEDIEQLASYMEEFAAKSVLGP